MLKRKLFELKQFTRRLSVRAASYAVIAVIGWIVVSLLVISFCEVIIDDPCLHSCSDYREGRL